MRWNPRKPKQSAFSETERDVAQRLLAWGKHTLPITDVYLWDDSGDIHIAFVGKALRLQTSAVDRMFNNHGFWLDRELQQALGLPGEMSRAGGRPYIRRQTMSEGETYIGELLDGVEQLAWEVLGVGDDATVSATLMPLEGSPWTGKPTVYYSAKKKRDFVTEAPPPRFRLDADHHGAGAPWGADYCAYAPKISCTDKTLVGVFDKPRAPQFLVTHSLNLEMRDDATQAIRECGGLLFPSLAVGVVPATNFGRLVLVGDIHLVLNGLRPYKRGRSQMPVAVYETDVWTETVSGLRGQQAAHLYEELTGYAEFTYSPQIYVLGPRVAEEERGRGIATTAKLRTTLTKRTKMYPEDLTKTDLEEIRAMYTIERYPYLEAKSNGIVDTSCFPLAVCSSLEVKEARSFLRRAGFNRTKLISVEEPDPDYLLENDRDFGWDYGWIVRDAILRWANKNRGYMQVEG